MTKFVNSLIEMQPKATNRTFPLLDKPLLWMVVIAMLTFIAYIPALNGIFTNWDDMMYVTGSPYIQSLSFKNIARIFTENYMGNYHPLTMLSLAIDYQFNKFDPFVFHLTNLLIHIINSILVMLVVRRLTGLMHAAAIAGLIFGVHALHVESVAWISERKDVLYTCFYLLSLLAYLRYLPKRDLKWIILSLLFFILSNLSKGQAVSLSLSLILVDLYKGRRYSDPKVIMEKVPYFLLSLIFGIVAFRAQAGADATIMANFPIQQRVAFASYGLVMYVLKLIMPVSLSAFYPYPIIGDVGEVPLVFWLSILPALAIILAMIPAWKRSKALFFGLGFFLVNIVFLLQLLPVGRAIMADRYAYVPSIGYCFLLGIYLSDRKIVRKAQITWIIVAVYAAVQMFLTFQQSKVWYSSLTLWTDVIEKNEKVPLAWYNRGNYKLDSADYQGAIADYSQCLTLDGTFWRAFINRGNARSKVQDYMGAIEDFNAMLRHDSTHVNAYINRANAQRMLKDYGNALRDYDRAIRMKPEQLELYTNRASVKIEMKDFSGALEDLDQAIARDPQYAQAYTIRAGVKKSMQDLTGALADYDKAIGIDPESSDFYNNRGNLKFQLGDHPGAIADYDNSIRLNPNDYLGFKNRATVRYADKQYAEALSDYTSAIGINPGSGELYYARSLVKKAMGDAEGAKADYEKAVASDPRFAAAGFMKGAGAGTGDTGEMGPESLNQQAKLLENQGKSQEAVAMYKKALAVKPDYAEAWFNLGNVYGKLKQYNEAMNCLNNAIKYKSDFSQALASRGIAYASMGKTDLAVSDLSAAIKGNPDYAVAYFNRALVYLNTGKRDMACADLQKAVKLGYTQAYAVYQRECNK